MAITLPYRTTLY